MSHKYSKDPEVNQYCPWVVYQSFRFSIINLLSSSMKSVWHLLNYSFLDISISSTYFHEEKPLKLKYLATSLLYKKVLKKHRLSPIKGKQTFSAIAVRE